MDLSISKFSELSESEKDVIYPGWARAVYYGLAKYPSLNSADEEIVQHILNLNDWATPEVETFNNVNFSRAVIMKLLEQSPDEETYVVYYEGKPLGTFATCEAPLYGHIMTNVGSFIEDFNPPPLSIRSLFVDILQLPECPPISYAMASKEITDKYYQSGDYDIKKIEDSSGSCIYLIGPKKL